MKKRIAALLTAAVMLVTFTACGGKKGETFRFDFEAAVTNLDPQFTTQDEAKTILANCMEGLLRQRADGTVELAAAANLQISPDFLTYTFTLRQDLEWSDGSPVTSEDFAFGLRRLFGPEAVSPYAEEFACLKNGGDILAGKKPVALLGVEAPSDDVLVLNLDRPNPFFEMLLCTPAALPCSPAFFEQTRGRYGLEQNALLYNGPFAVSVWNEEKLVLYSREDYQGPDGQALPEAAVFYIGRENTQELLLDGKTDAGELDPANLSRAVEKGLNYSAYDNTTWALIFNQTHPMLASPDIRRAMQMTLDRAYITDAMEDRFTPANAMIPPTILLDEGRSYREAAGDPLDPVYTPETGRALYQQTLEATETEEEILTLLLPEGEPYQNCAGLIQQQWQQNLSLYLNLEILPWEEYVEKLVRYDYDLVLAPVRSVFNSPAGVLSKYMTGSGDNLARYSSPAYDQLVADIGTAVSVEEMVRCAARAEDMLINDAVAIPLFLSTSYFATGESVRGVEYYPYSGCLTFYQAEK